MVQILPQCYIVTMLGHVFNIGM